MEQQITRPMMDSFIKELQEAERSTGTIEKYRRDVQSFAAWLNGREVTREAAAGWKHYLQEQGYNPATINSMLVALNRFFDCMGWQDCRVNTLKLQRRMFRSADRELTKEEYIHLIETARAKGKERLALLMETICATGIRVSEVQYITVEAARQGRTEISLKGKIRTILLPGKLCKKLLKYAKKQKNRLRRDLSHQKRYGFIQEADMGGDESDLQARRRYGFQGFSAQPAAPVRADFLPHQP